MTLPKLAIIGRPNVGKSALFNKIAKKRIAIVDSAEGITRDRLYAESELFGFPFTIIDTGGIDPTSEDQFREGIRTQAEKGIEEADRIIMVVDGKVGVTETDEWLCHFLFKKGKPFVVAVNKIDGKEQEKYIDDFYQLGALHVIGISALHGFQVVELLELAWEGFEKKDCTAQEKPAHKISIVGRPNAGKSTLINALLCEERCLVSNVPGTTRDAVEIPFEYNKQHFTLIDTAGFRKKKSEKEVVEKFASVRTEEAIKSSDLVFLVLDANDGLTSFEKKIIAQIEYAGASCILLLNKWDLITGFRMEHSIKAMAQENPFLAHCPVLCISAKTKRNIDKIFPTMKKVLEAKDQRITTGQLNKFVERLMQLYHPPAINGKRLRIYYLTQIKTNPPIFTLFVNHPELMAASYERYLLNQFRKTFGFPGTPLRFLLRGKKTSSQL